jgi:hypothetical protein
VITLCYVDMVDMANFIDDGPTSSLALPQPISSIERRSQRDRERYAQMSDDKKNELLARRQEAYQQKKSLAGKDCTLPRQICIYINNSMHNYFDDVHQHGLLLLHIIIMSLYQRKLKKKTCKGKDPICRYDF